ncbi:PEP-CTERM sorting domain-containing protein [Candidatus Parcubacteria bacterium]|nr:MAG: PEP-CTERM sorting domain-containing protein [Candidatus Parcubacteria bacterium]
MGDSDWYIGEVTHGTHDYSAIVPPGYFYGDPVWFFVTLRSDRGDFAIDKSVLTVYYDPNPEPVPLPATMFLLGNGLIGLAGVSLRRRNK